MPVLFWHLPLVIWQTSRDVDTVQNKTIMVPAWTMASVVFLIGRLLYVFPLGTVKPPTMFSTMAFRCCTISHTISGDKTRDRLEFEPVFDHDAEVVRAVR